ncbi:MAG TPA: hypothetical protein VGB88_15460 [Alphaproteobacteria bacterium]
MRARARDEPVKGRGRCPRCACRKVRHVSHGGTPFYARNLEVCVNCGALWEPLPPGGDHRDSDGTPFPFPEPCDNCAFRAGSPEQQDTPEWKKMMAKLKAGGPFYCHKGVPIEPDGEHGFAYPKAHRKLRLCRGYLHMRFAKLPSAEPAPAKAGYPGEVEHLCFVSDTEGAEPAPSAPPREPPS